MNEKKRSGRRKHCALAVVRRSRKFSSRRRPLPGGAGRPNLFSWRWSLPSTTNPVWWGSMHAISSQWFPNTQQYRFLTACRHLEKLVLPSIFDTTLSSLMCRAVLNEWMWHFRGNILGSLLHIFRGWLRPHPQDLCPCWNSPTIVFLRLTTKTITTHVVRCLTALFLPLAKRFYFIHCGSKKRASFGGL